MTPRFSPYLFLRLGRSLSKSPSESRRRTAVGRLYYACHLKAREDLAARGIVVPRFQAHKFVIVQLRQAGHPHANMLKQLKGMREASDYDLTTPVTAGHVRRALYVTNFIWPTL